MTILAIIIIVLVGLYILGGLIFKHRLFITKLTIIPLIIAVGILVISNQFGSDEVEYPGGNVQYYQKVEPPFEEAPLVVQTSSRIYYVATLIDEGDILTLTDYYYFDKKKWVYSDVPLPLDRNTYGNMKVYNR